MALHRHSSLPELQNFVALFRPKRIIPNFLQPTLHGIDWACMLYMFGDHMAPGGVERLREELRLAGAVNHLSQLNENDLIEDLEFSNMEGGCGSEALDALVAKWAVGIDTENGQTKTGLLIRIAQAYLPKGVCFLIDRALRTARQKKPVQSFEDEDSDDSSSKESHGRTAEIIFGIQRSTPDDETPVAPPANNTALSNVLEHKLEPGKTEDLSSISNTGKPQIALKESTALPHRKSAAEGYVARYVDAAVQVDLGCICDMKTRLPGSSINHTLRSPVHLQTTRALPKDANEYILANSYAKRIRLDSSLDMGNSNSPSPTKSISLTGVIAEADELIGLHSVSLQDAGRRLKHEPHTERVIAVSSQDISHSLQIGQLKTSSPKPNLGNSRSPATAHAQHIQPSKREPPSPAKSPKAKRGWNEERIRLSEKLRRARPDLAIKKCGP